MCRATTCKTCGKTTWAGCGQHVTQVKASVPAGQWCPGHPKAEKQKAGKQKAGKTEKSGGGFLSRILGR